MKALFRFLLLPIQAPMLLVLVAVSTYLGLHWSRPLLLGESQLSAMAHLVWSAECLQALLVVILCTLPQMLLSHLSSLMAASRFLTLVVALLGVTVGGLYLMNAHELANVLILASAVLLARLDLVRIRVAASPLLVAVSMALVVLGGVNLGRIIGSRLLWG
jgi:hypothetical protein